jgi:hypothetical protein
LIESNGKMIDGHILVDFDRTLANYESWSKNGSSLGAPIPAMAERVRRWVDSGKDVRIFTARAAPNNPRRDDDIRKIMAWCEEHIGRPLPVTNQKDFETVAIWDDLAVSVEANTGWRSGDVARGQDPLTYEEELHLSGWDARLGSLDEAP